MQSISYGVWRIRSAQKQLHMKNIKRTISDRWSEWLVWWVSHMLTNQSVFCQDSPDWGRVTDFVDASALTAMPFSGKIILLTCTLSLFVAAGKWLHGPKACVHSICLNTILFFLILKWWPFVFFPMEHQSRNVGGWDSSLPKTEVGSIRHSTRSQGVIGCGCSLGFQATSANYF